jgi:hypothetical protein
MSSISATDSSLRPEQHRREQNACGAGGSVYFRDTPHSFSRLGGRDDSHVEIYGLVEDGTVSAPAMTCASRAFAPSLF